MLLYEWGKYLSVGLLLSLAYIAVTYLDCRKTGGCLTGWQD
jgi:hypothetical protein